MQLFLWRRSFRQIERFFECVERVHRARAPADYCLSLEKRRNVNGSLLTASLGIVCTHPRHAVQPMRQSVASLTLLSGTPEFDSSAAAMALLGIVCHHIVEGDDRLGPEERMTVLGVELRMGPLGDSYCEYIAQQYQASRIGDLSAATLGLLEETAAATPEGASVIVWSASSSKQGKMLGAFENLQLQARWRRLRQQAEVIVVGPGSNVEGVLRSVEQILTRPLGIRKCIIFGVMRGILSEGINPSSLVASTGATISAPLWRRPKAVSSSFKNYLYSTLYFVGLQTGIL